MQSLEVGVVVREVRMVDLLGVDAVFVDGHIGEAYRLHRRVWCRSGDGEDAKRQEPLLAELEVSPSRGERFCQRG